MLSIWHNTHEDFINYKSRVLQAFKGASFDFSGVLWFVLDEKLNDDKKTKYKWIKLWKNGRITKFKIVVDDAKREKLATYWWAMSDWIWHVNHEGSYSF